MSKDGSILNTSVGTSSNVPKRDVEGICSMFRLHTNNPVHG